MSLLTAKAIGKRFGGLQALHEVSFAITAGEIFGLIGPNGAGKTTLFNLLTGIYAPNAGAFSFDARDITAHARPHRGCRLAPRSITLLFRQLRLRTS